MSNIPDCVIVDDCDREFLEAIGKWCISNDYCVRNGPWDPVAKRNGKHIYMHRLVLERKLGRPIAAGMFCDHIQPGNKLDNSRANLREVTRQQNAMNTRAKGYYWNKEKGKWHARIMTNGKYKFLGYYDTETEAAAAYERGKAIHHKIP